MHLPTIAAACLCLYSFCVRMFGVHLMPPNGCGVPASLTIFQSESKHVSLDQNSAGHGALASQHGCWQSKLLHEQRFLTHAYGCKLSTCPRCTERRFGTCCKVDK